MVPTESPRRNSYLDVRFTYFLPKRAINLLRAADGKSETSFKGQYYLKEDTLCGGYITTVDIQKPNNTKKRTICQRRSVQSPSRLHKL